MDVATDPELSFSFFYLIPIGFVTWFGGRTAGIVVSIFSATIWAVDQHTHYPLYWILNAASTVGIFCMMNILIAKIREMWEHESLQSRRDHLTGLMNSRAFIEIAKYEILRLQREGAAYSIGYIDLDNFKEINDRYGHNKGDELLKIIASCFLESLRKTDVVARIGGDEFTIFFPETNYEAAHVVINKVRDNLLKKLGEGNWPTTFSMGVVTCAHSPCELDTIITIADDLMYEAKKAGKNSIRFAQYLGSDSTVCR
jgi:diguanylate cyclase (GGDEF)-like protein